MTDDMALAAGFPAGTEALWRSLVEKALAGASAETLESRTEHGVSVKALYRESDWPSSRDASGLPGAHPFIRGPNAARDPFLPWDIRQVIARPDPSAAAAEALEALEGGASSIELRIDAEGLQGIAIGGRLDLERVLAPVRLDLAPVALETAGGSAAPGIGPAILLAAVAHARGAADKGFAFNIDPIGALAVTGALTGPEAAPLLEAAAFVRDAAPEFPAATFIRIDARPVHEAGGAEVQELAFLASAGAQWMRDLISAGMSADGASRALLFSLSIGADYHVELAKLRAARRIWSRIAEAFGVTPAASAMRLQAVTARRMLARRDPWVNLLRNTAACFAAGVGGADIVTVRPYTDAIGQPGKLARRLARNTQIIAQEESGLGRIADPAGGAWSFERLGEDLAQAAWQLFQNIEREGGLIQALANGGFQQGVAAARMARVAAVARRTEWITGVNDFPALDEPLTDADPAPTFPVPNVLAAAGPRPLSRSYTALKEAALAGAGLFSLEPEEAATIEAEPLWPIRLSEPFERLRDRADAKRQAGAPLRIFLAALGPLAEHSARLTFAQNFFAVGGIDAESSFGDAAALAEAFRRSGLQLCCICGSDRRYGAEAVDIARALKAAGAGRIYLAGKGGDIADTLRSAGVEEFIHVGVDVLASLEQAHAELGLGH